MTARRTTLWHHWKNHSLLSEFPASGYRVCRSCSHHESPPCIGSRRDIFKVAARLRFPDLNHHHIRCRVEKFMRESIRRFKQRTGYGAGAVSYVQNIHMDSRAGGLGKSHSRKIRTHQRCRPCYGSNSHDASHIQVNRGVSPYPVLLDTDLGFTASGTFTQWPFCCGVQQMSGRDQRRFEKEFLGNGFKGRAGHLNRPAL